MDAIAIVCKQCGSKIPVLENKGKLICPSCSTEYILDTVEGEKILNEFHFENPFIKLERNLDSNLQEICDFMDVYHDYGLAYNNLLKIAESDTYRYGYWILRIRAYTEDFKKIFDNYKPFEEIFDCIKEHLRLSVFEEKELDCLEEYFSRNKKILMARCSVLKEESLSAENEIFKLSTEKHKVEFEISKLSDLISTGENITANTKKEHPNIYLFFKIAIIISSIFAGLFDVFAISIVLIPGLLILILPIIVLLTTIFFVKHTIEVYEFAFVTKINKLLPPLYKRSNEIKNLIIEYKTTCVKCLYEFKCTLKVLDYNLKRVCEDEKIKNSSFLKYGYRELEDEKEKPVKNIFKRIGDTFSSAMKNIFISSEKAKYMKIQKILKTEDDVLIKEALDYWNLLDQIENTSFKNDRVAFWI